MKKIFIALIVFIGFAGSEFSCTKSIPDCPTQFCILAGGWKLTAVYEEDILQNQDLSKFKMILTLPDQKVASGGFDRFNSLGTEDIGSWSIQNNNTILQLTPETSPAEPYIIQSLSLRQMVLVINRDSNKTGPKQIKYVFEPI